MSVLISIHALREESDVYFIREQFKAMEISIHALREESDSSKTGSNKETNIFLSTPPARRATHGNAKPQPGMDISIHALREESDTGTADKPAPYEDFYPRPPRGERQRSCISLVRAPIFLSTPSARRATPGLGDKWFRENQISIHALREESDANTVKQRVDFLISIHALREESDSKNRDKISIFL